MIRTKIILLIILLKSLYYLLQSNINNKYLKSIKDYQYIRKSFLAFKLIKLKLIISIIIRKIVKNITFKIKSPRSKILTRFKI